MPGTGVRSRVRAVTSSYQYTAMGGIVRVSSTHVRAHLCKRVGLPTGKPVAGERGKGRGCERAESKRAAHFVGHRDDCPVGVDDQHGRDVYEVRDGPPRHEAAPVTDELVRPLWATHKATPVRRQAPRRQRNRALG